jgi:hypothetical protein
LISIGKSPVIVRCIFASIPNGIPLIYIPAALKNTTIRCFCLVVGQYGGVSLDVKRADEANGRFGGSFSPFRSSYQLAYYLGMVLIYGAAAAAALIKLACPHCGEVQARPRKPKGERYRCRKCHHLFTREQGQAASKRSGV